MGGERAEVGPRPRRRIPYYKPTLPDDTTTGGSQGGGGGGHAPHAAMAQRAETCARRRALHGRDERIAEESGRATWRERADTEGPTRHCRQPNALKLTRRGAGVSSALRKGESVRRKSVGAGIDQYRNAAGRWKSEEGAGPVAGSTRQ